MPTLFDKPAPAAAAGGPANRTLLVARLAARLCCRALPERHGRFARKTYSPRSLMACLLLRAVPRQTYRGVVELLALSPDLRDAVGLDRTVPRHTTLQAFAGRWATPAVMDDLLRAFAATLREAGVPLDGPAADVALDSTGLEGTDASAHFVSRRGKPASRYAKLSAAVLCGTIFCLAAVASAGPGHDLAEARPLLWKLGGVARPGALYADKGYDAEWVHAFCRDGMGTRSYVPPVARGGHGAVRSPRRAAMTRVDAGGHALYGRRWHAESFFSGLKRVCGSRLRGKTEASRLAEALVRTVAYNLWLL